MSSEISNLSNNLSLVTSLVDMLSREGLDIWVFGGWGEELRGMRPPGPHSDIDLLLHAPNFDALEDALARSCHSMPIPEKRFSHKRGFEWMGVRVEVFLARPGAVATSNVFDGRHVIRWPSDTFEGEVVQDLQVVSATALAEYRRDHRHVAQAYASFCESRDFVG